MDYQLARTNPEQLKNHPASWYVKKIRKRILTLLARTPCIYRDIYDDVTRTVNGWNSQGARIDLILSALRREGVIEQQHYRWQLREGMTHDQA